MIFDFEKYQFTPTSNQMGYMANFLDKSELWFLEFLEKNNGLGVDLGTAYGFLCLEALKRNLPIVGVDMDSSHLEKLKEEAKDLLGDKHRLLSTKVGRFPEEIDFEKESLTAVNTSRMFHFLTGTELEQGTRKILNWLKPGGVLTIGVLTPFSHMVRGVSSIYKKNKQNGVQWPGEIHPKEIPEMVEYYKENLPLFAHVLEKEVLCKILIKAGYEIIHSVEATPIIMPEEDRLDGREFLFVMAQKPKKS